MYPNGGRPTRPFGSNESEAGLEEIAVGDRLRVVGGTNGHMLWLPAAIVFEVMTGAQAGTRVQFIAEPDPRPAGDLAVTASLVVIGIEEPVLSDPARLAQLHEAITRVLTRR